MEAMAKVATIDNIAILYSALDYSLERNHDEGAYGERWSCFAGQMAVWLRWILGLITPPISPRLPA